MRKLLDQIGGEFFAERAARFEQLRQILHIAAGIGIADHRECRRPHHRPGCVLAHVGGQHLAQYQMFANMQHGGVSSVGLMSVA